MKVNGKMIDIMEKECIHLQMVINMKENIKMEINMENVHLKIKMEQYMMEIGKMENAMEKEYLNL